MRDDTRETSFEALLQSGLLDIGDGYRAKNEELGGDGPIFLRAGHVTDTHIDFSGVERFHSNLAERVLSKMSRPGDTIVTTKGNSTGRTSFVTEAMPEFVYSPHLCYWRSRDPARLAAGFLRYWARSSEFQTQLQGMAASTDMAPYLSLTDQRRLRITLPDPETQRAIASILGALDDKIDLNRRMNETLEELARTIFKSWFVDFDPVRAKAAGRQPVRMDAETAKLFPDRLVDSELGPIPNGWRAPELSAVLSRITDGAHSSPPSTDQGKPMASVKDMHNWGINLRTCRTIAESDFDELVGMGCQPRKGDVLLAKDGATCLETACEFQQDADLVLLSSVAILRPAQPTASSYLHVWLTLGSTKQYLREGFVSGSAIPRVVLKDLKRARLVFPAEALLTRYDNIVAATRARARGNLAESETLSSLRDTLLPKLISGELRIKDAEKMAEAAL